MSAVRSTHYGLIDRGKLLVTQVKMDQVIMICDRVYDADLLVIPMKDIAVILGMDWLSDHGA